LGDASTIVVKDMVWFMSFYLLSSFGDITDVG
jgi:hypothetical protein